MTTKDIIDKITSMGEVTVTRVIKNPEVQTAQNEQDGSIANPQMKALVNENQTSIPHTLN